MKIGIMGGTFDPIHNGHLVLGEYAYRQFDLDEVWFMPNGNPPHKQKVMNKTDAKIRATMVELAIAGEEHFRVEMYEIERGGLSYSYQTMEHFKETRPEDHFYFIIGADSLFAFETWMKPDRILRTCTVLAAYRDEMNTREVMEDKIEDLKEKYSADIRLLETPLVPAASHELREKIRLGESITGMVPAAVEAYIYEHGLYREHTVERED